jgi:hypothetical protein
MRKNYFIAAVNTQPLLHAAVPCALLILVCSSIFAAGIAPGIDPAIAPAMAMDNAQTKALMDEYAAGKYDVAFKRCIAILKADTSNMTAHYYMGNLYLKYKKYDEATAEYNYVMAAGADTPEGQAAKQGLDAVEQAKSAVPPLSDVAPPVEAKLQERIDRLRKEADEQIASKKKIYDTGVAYADNEYRAQMPAYVYRTTQGYSGLNSLKSELGKERQDRVDLLKRNLERETKDINADCEKRIKDLQDSYANVQRPIPVRH